MAQGSDHHLEKIKRVSPNMLGGKGLLGKEEQELLLVPPLAQQHHSSHPQPKGSRGPAVIAEKWSRCAPPL